MESRNSYGRGGLKAIQKLRDLGQGLWLDNITRNWLKMGVFERYIDVDALSAQLQDESAKSFVNSWNDLPAGFESKTSARG